VAIIEEQQKFSRVKFSSDHAVLKLSCISFSKSQESTRFFYKAPFKMQLMLPAYFDIKLGKDEN